MWRERFAARAARVGDGWVFTAGQGIAVAGVVMILNKVLVPGVALAASGAGMAVGNMITAWMRDARAKAAGGRVEEHVFFVQMGRPEWEECPNCGVNLVLPGRDKTMRLRCDGASMTMPPGFAVTMASCGTCGMLWPEDATAP